MDSTVVKSAPQLYWVCACGAAAFSLGVGFATGLIRKRRRMKTIAQSENGWRELLPNQSRSTRRAGALFLVLTSGLPLLVLSALLWPWRELDGGGRTFVVISLSVVIVELVWLVRAIIACRASDDARVFFQAERVTRDQEFAWRVSVPARGGNTEICGRVICIEHAVVHQGRFTHIDHRIVREQPLRLTGHPAGEDRLAAEGALHFPTERWPASGPGKSLNFNYEWQLHVELPGRPGQVTIFPLDVT